MRSKDFIDLAAKIAYPDFSAVEHQHHGHDGCAGGHPWRRPVGDISFGDGGLHTPSDHALNWNGDDPEDCRRAQRCCRPLEQRCDAKVALLHAASLRCRQIQKKHIYRNGVSRSILDMIRKYAWKPSR
jgi:hypothetical protein